jgi:DNA polymerase-3 subunit chi
MRDSGDTSVSAGSNAASSSLPDSSAGDTKLRVDFYVTEDSASTARLKLACRLAEKAYLANQTALVWDTDPEELETLDELLWTFMDGSFVPHDVLGNAEAGTGAGPESPVLLSSGAAPPADVDIIINLAPEIPACLARTRRVAEIIDGDEARRRAGRVRFKAYRDMGIQPASHPLRSDRGP